MIDKLILFLAGVLIVLFVYIGYHTNDWSLLGIFLVALIVGQMLGRLVNSNKNE